jgi:hypothetical protein
VPHERRSELLRSARGERLTRCFAAGCDSRAPRGDGRCGRRGQRVATRGAPSGPVLHLAGDRLPRGLPLDSPRDRTVCGHATLARGRPAHPATLGAAASSAPDLEHVIPLLRPGKALSTASAGTGGPFPAYVQLLLAGGFSAALIAPHLGDERSPVRVLLVYAVVDVRSSPTARSVTPTTGVHARGGDELSRAAELHRRGCSQESTRR